MIAYLKGKIVARDEKKLILLTEHGVGYEVNFPLVPVNKNEDELSLFVTQINREHSVELYGHQGLKEKELFELLLNVKGIGPKSAFTLVHHLGCEDIYLAIRRQDPLPFTKVNGIGKKSAAQIILDLKDKAEVFSNSKLIYKEESLEDREKGLLKRSVREDASLALKELGISEKKFIPILEKLLGERDFDRPSELVKSTLIYMS